MPYSFEVMSIRREDKISHKVNGFYLLSAMASNRAVRKYSTYSQWSQPNRMMRLVRRRKCNMLL